MSLIEKIKSLVERNHAHIVSVRRHLHQNPELSFEEFETFKYIQLKLEEIGITSIQQIGNTGITFTIQGATKGKVIALRADIDALPITEENQVPYRSTRDGVMHACGHDVHTANLIGVAKVLYDLKNEFSGTVKFIFQPAEEKAPGGASILIKEGVLESPTPSNILGLHVMPFIPVGKVGFRKGRYMASADELYLTILGKGGHAAMPETFIDPIAIAAQVITSLQQVVSRMANPRTPTVLSFGKIVGGTTNNVIPNKVEIEGTFRTLDDEWRGQALKKIERIAKEVAASLGGECQVNIVKGYPFLFNDEAYTIRNISHARTFLGVENVVALDVWMAAEDFANYTHHVPGCFYRLGTRNEEKNIISGVHTPTFDVDENALKVGVGLMSYLAIKELETP